MKLLIGAMKVYNHIGDISILPTEITTGKNTKQNIFLLFLFSTKMEGSMSYGHTKTMKSSGLCDQHGKIRGTPNKHVRNTLTFD